MVDITNIPLYSIFILILILAGGYTIELIPCRLKKLLTENIFIKHFFCLLTLIFFISITDTDQNNGKNLRKIILNSIFLYIIFMFLIKTHYKFFIVILILLSIIYLLKLKNDEIIQQIDNEQKKYLLDKTELNIQKYKEQQYYILIIKKVLIIITLINIIIGFIIYLFEKKNKYKNKFDYITFIFGVQKCTLRE
jgi:hypothetical protein